jgi:hypothetical protein
MTDDTKEIFPGTKDNLDKLTVVDKSGDYMDSLLTKADGACLLWEVVYFALMAMKKDPTLDEADALSIGYHEWVK